jgi:hypothetical protein
MTVSYSYRETHAFFYFEEKMMKTSLLQRLAKLSVAAAFAAVSSASAQEVPVVNVGGTKISLYGFLQANAVYEDGNNDGNNWTERVPTKAEDGEGRFAFNVNQTRVGFNLAGPQAEGKPEISGKFEIDFANNNARNNNGVGNLRIRQSYGQVKFKDVGFTLLLGQTNDLIGPLSVPTLSQSGLKASGSLGTRRPMLRLTQALGPAEIAVAATDNRDGVTLSNIDTASTHSTNTTNSILPAFQGSVKVKIPATWAGEKQNLELTLGGVYGTGEPALIKEMPDDKKKDKYPSALGGVASLAVPVINIIGLSGEMFYGQNLKNYSDGTLNISNCRRSADREKGCYSIGGWGALTVKLPANFSFAGGLGLESLDEDTEPSSGPNKTMTIFGNLKYNVAETAFIGFEYARLQTDYIGKVDSGKLNRFELALNYAFK